MASYNGARFIGEQLDSIALQTYPPYELLIGDDGSTDGTPEIIRAFAATAPFPVLLTKNSERLGFSENFLTVAARCSGDWIAFCDQDDIWRPEKLERCAEAIAEADGDLMMIVHSADMTDAALAPSLQRLPDIRRRRRTDCNGLPGLWMSPGFAMVVRSCLIHEIDWRERPPDSNGQDDRAAHDSWCCMLANALGGVLCLPESVALYRRHDSAISGPHTRPDLRSVISIALATGGDHYAQGAGIARQYARHFDRLAGTTAVPDWPRRLRATARHYEHLAAALQARSELYHGRGPMRRLATLLVLLWHGGYLGHPFSTMGARALLKDLAICIWPNWRRMLP